MAKSGSYRTQGVLLGDLEIPFWADDLCKQLLEVHALSQQDAIKAAILMTERGIAAVPALDVQFTLMGVRQSKGAKESTNDLIDIMRISNALPLADFMIIDASKADDVRQSGLDARYKTQVFSGRPDDLAQLEKILRQTLLIRP